MVLSIEHSHSPPATDRGRPSLRTFDMTNATVLSKNELEIRLRNEKQLVDEGVIKEDNPLDLSLPFRQLCDACRKGDLKVCQEKINEGVNINARDPYDYTPLILASLCGHFDVVRLLLESGALCERDTFQGERCLYNALNDRIRNLLLEYDYSKSTDPLQPLAAHISSLLARDHPVTSDIVVAAADESLHLHKFILAARSSYFRKKLGAAPETPLWKLPSAIPPQAFGAAIKYLYLGEVPHDFRSGPGTGYTESDVLTGLDKIARTLEIEGLLDTLIANGDRRLTRQRRTAEVAKGQQQLKEWFQQNVLQNKVVVDISKANDVKWDRNNAVFADVLLRADESPEDLEEENGEVPEIAERGGSIPIGPAAASAVSVEKGRSRKSTLYPCHRAMLLRSEFFNSMFSSTFREAHVKDYLHIVQVDCSPEVLEIILTFLYVEEVIIPLDLAVDVLFAADMLLIEKLKTKAAVAISMGGSGNMSQSEASKTRTAKEEEELDIYSIIRAAWLTRMQRLEEFAARYIAYHLEAHVDSAEFAELIRESAARIQGRQETDSIELLDDIRYYLGERYRLRFDDAGLEEMMTGREQEEEEEEGGGGGGGGGGGWRWPGH
ncbi:hypothetical protein MAP00_006653 [Monascus purpureus]|nr:hypothetical protein MAP00_006653 [Monascus purpureus]